MLFNPGVIAETQHSFTQADFDRFAALSGDDNPIHVDPAFAARTRFGRTAAHGMLIYGILCATITQHFPGAQHREQEMIWRNPTFTNQPFTIRLELLERCESADGAGALLDLSLTCSRADAATLCESRTRIALHPAAPNLHWATPAPEADDPAATLKGMVVGQRAQITRSFRASDLHDYATLTGDTHPDGIQRPIPGPLLGGMFSYILGTILPGRGTNYLKQRIAYHSTAVTDEPITATLQIIRLRPEKQLVNLTTHCHGVDGRLICDGEALVLARDVAQP